MTVYHRRLGAIAATAAVILGSSAAGWAASAPPSTTASSTGFPVITYQHEGASTANGINDYSTATGIDRIGGTTQRAVVWDADGTERVLAFPDGSVQTDAQGINNRGMVVGSYGFIGPFGGGTALFSAALKWDSDGHFVQLPDLPHTGPLNSGANAINDREVAVGASAGSGRFSHAVRWDANGNPTDLGTIPGDSATAAKAVNEAGEAVGFARLLLGGTHALFWDRDGNITDLTPNSKGTNIARGINDSGQIVGDAPVGGRQHAVLWDKQGNMTDLGTLPGGARSVANGINQLGEITGWSDFGSFRHHAVVWDAQHNILDLGAVPGDFDFTEGKGLNNRRQVVGISDILTGDFLDPRAVRWDTRGGATGVTTSTAPSTTTTTPSSTTTTMPVTTTTVRPTTTTTTAPANSCAQSVQAQRQAFNSAIDAQEAGQGGAILAALEQARAQQNAAFDRQLAAC